MHIICAALQVMELLLRMTSDYWENFLNIDDDTVQSRTDYLTPQTPEGRQSM